MKKVVAVTLNPCVDYTITVPGLQKGKKNLEKKALSIRLLLGYLP